MKYPRGDANEVAMESGRENIVPNLDATRAGPLSSRPVSFELQTPHSKYALLHARLFVPLVLLGMTLAMFAGVLFLPGDQVLSQLGMDTSNIFVYWRQFGFGQLRAGNFALWNPEVFSGFPFVGAFQTALLYPPNWILYLTLPLAKAINYEFALHVFLLGLFMAMWVERYGLHPLAVLLAACVVMFARPFFGGILTGHLAHMDSMAWIPLILLSIDALLDQPSAKWVMIGIFAFSMQALAGYPQVLFNTIVTGAIYVAIRLVRAPRPVRTVLALSVVGVGAVMICAAQLWLGWEAAAEGTRQGGTSFAYASSLSLTYDNLLTLLVPDFFGDQIRLTCWGGGGALPGSVMFFGLTGLTMAIFGARVKSPLRGTWIIMAVVLLCIALGPRTPLFGLLYRVVPGFNLFRRPAAFTFEFVLFMAMLSAFGMDALIRSAGGAKTAAVGLLILGLAFGAFGAAALAGVSVTFNAIWHDFVQAVAKFAQPVWPPQNFSDPAFAAAAERFASVRCLFAAGICLLLAALLFLRSARPQAAYIVAVLGVAEAFFFARFNVTTFPLAATVPVQLQQFMAAHPGDYRILDLAFDGVFLLSMEDSAIAVGANDIWGYDPTVPRRYAEFMTYSQGADPEYASMRLDFRGGSPMLRLLRLRYVFSGDKVFPAPGDLPHLLLVDGWRQIEQRNDILAALSAPSFDPGKTVILERDPEPAPVPGAEPGAARLLSTTTDSLTIAADVTRPALLLITDSYSRYWRAVALTGSSQSEYHVMPADYTLMAVPLGPGHHLFRLEYAPPGWVIGRWVSLASLLVFLGAAIGLAVKRRSENSPRR